MYVILPPSLPPSLPPYLWAEEASDAFVLRRGVMNRRRRALCLPLPSSLPPSPSLSSSVLRAFAGAAGAAAVTVKDEGCLRVVEGTDL